MTSVSFDDVAIVVEIAVQILTGVGIIGGALVALFASQWFRPVLAIDLSTRWRDSYSCWLIVHLTFENRSRVKMQKKQILLQCLEYAEPASPWLSEWVPFDEDHIPEGERPLSWRAPMIICPSTQVFAPADRVSVECLVKARPQTVVKVAVQFRARLRGISAVLYGGNTESWTRTIVVDAPKPCSVRAQE